MAEALFNARAKEMGVGAVADSAGVSSYHEGEPADHRTLLVLAEEGLAEPSRARKVRESDFSEFDHIVAMDEGHLRELTVWRGSVPSKLTLFLEWSGQSGSVKDPYYGSPNGFREMYDVIDRGVLAMLERLRHPEVG